MIMSEQDPPSESANSLLVEDNPGDVRLTREAFKESSIANTLHVVTDGVEALDFLHRRGDYGDAPRPDIILLDLTSPGRTVTSCSRI
jgi:CheY-like chemotaxis protein